MNYLCHYEWYHHARRNNKFNAIKNALAMDIKGYLEKAEKQE